MNPAMASSIEFIGQELRTPLLIVHVLNERVLDRDTAPGRQEVGAGRIEEFTHLPPRVDRNQLIAQVIIGSMQGHGQRHRHPLPRQLTDRRNQANRRDSDVASAHTKALGCRINEAMQRTDHRLVVGQRLPHPHEHDVRQSRRATRQRAVAARGLRVANLIDDLGRRQITGQPHLACRAERARHTAPRLRRHAQSRTLRITHKDRLDLRAVIETPQILNRATAIRLQRNDLRHESRQKRLTHLRAHTCRNITHALRIRLEVREVMTRQLVSTECGQAQILQDLLASCGVEIRQMRRSLAPALRSKRQDRLRILVRRTLRGLIRRTHLAPRTTANRGHSNGLVPLTPIGPGPTLRRLTQCLDSQEIPGSAHAKMK